MADKIRWEDLTTQLGASGTQIVNGFIEEDYRHDLQGRDGAKIYDEMRRSDATVFASLLICELPIRSTKWSVEPATKGDETINKQVAEYVENCLFEKINNTWDDLLREILTMLPFGFSVFEKVWASDDNGIYLKKLGFRKQNTIQRWKTPDEKPGITQILPGMTDDMVDKSGSNNIGIPAQKLLTFSFRKEGANFEGTSILRSSYKHRYIKDKLYKFDAVRHERQSIGIPIIYLPKGASEGDKAQALALVKNIRSTEQTGIVMPGPRSEGREFEFADTKAGTSTNYFESINHHNREITKNVLAQFLELGNTESGSRALGESQSSMFLLSLIAVAKQIADTINKELIKELVDFNFDVEDYPKLTFQDLGSIDISKVTTAISSFVGAGLITVDEGMEKYVRNLLELPEKIEDDGVEDIEEGEVDDTTEEDMATEEVDEAEEEVQANEEFEEFIEDLMEFSEDEAKDYIFKMPVSEEAKKKISEKLKAYWATRKKPEDIKAERQKKSGETKGKIQGIKDQIESLKSQLVKGKGAGKKNKAVREQMKALRGEIKGIRDVEKGNSKASRESEKKIKLEIRNQNKKLKAVLKMQKEKIKLIKQGLGIKVPEDDEYYCEHCQTDDLYFDDKYFGELSKKIDNDYISKLQTEGSK